MPTRNAPPGAQNKLHSINKTDGVRRRARERQLHGRAVTERMYGGPGTWIISAQPHPRATLR